MVEMNECERLVYASKCVVSRWKNASIRFKARNASWSWWRFAETLPPVSGFQGPSLDRARKAPDPSFHDAGKSHLLRTPKEMIKKHLIAENAK